ncbi:hypothetical protein GCM10009590_03990 [Brachybacterium alimentarium]
MQQMGEVEQSAHMTRGDHGRAVLVATQPRAAHVGELLPEPGPVSGHRVSPHGIGIPGERLPDPGEGSRSIAEHRTGSHLEDGLPREGQPVVERESDSRPRRSPGPAQTPMRRAAR